MFSSQKLFLEIKNVEKGWLLEASKVSSFNGNALSLMILMKNLFALIHNRNCAILYRLAWYRYCLFQYLTTLYHIIQRSFRTEWTSYTFFRCFFLCLILSLPPLLLGVSLSCIPQHGQNTPL
jgi:hypothetical protein